VPATRFGNSGTMVAIALCRDAGDGKSALKCGEASPGKLRPPNSPEFLLLFSAAQLGTLNQVLAAVTRTSVQGSLWLRALRCGRRGSIAPPCRKCLQSTQ
jgi:hypothetical protein